MGNINTVLKTFILITILAACVYPAHAQTEEPAEAKIPLREKIKTAAVMPFSSKSALSAEMPAETLADKERFLMISFYDALIAEESIVKITPLKESEAAYAGITYENPVSYFRDAAVEAGRKLGVDAVFTGVISEHTERKGSGAGVESPATVAFSVELLDTKDGSILWETYFTETQRPLLDNLYEIDKFFKRGAKWITVDELTKEGARKAASDFNTFLTTE
ncbi:MAG: hypothetical protein KJ002_07180 [Candidatus Dadabacteria bacterium]|nr:hypothetical protein [Candidatus Dadabacteria bacterium]